MKQIVLMRYESAVGGMVIGAFGERICMCDWVGSRRHEAALRKLQRVFGAECVEGMTEVTGRAVAQLDEYFEGKRRAFDVPVVFAGTEFQRRVWRELQRIGYGETVSYAELARRVGSPRAVRAVANANAVNPISILVPCHRVIGANGMLTGYGGGVEVKRRLLVLENCRRDWVL